jgi:hypothetical protein
MDAIEFVTRYPAYIEQLEKVVKPEYQYAVKKLNEINPHDIVKPEHYFNSEAEGVGVVCRMFLRLANTKPVKLTKQEKRQKLDQDIEAAKQLLSANGIQSQGLWCIDDIIDKANELKKRCSKKDARIILTHIEQDFDAEFGITWQTLEQAVVDYFQKRKLK